MRVLLIASILFATQISTTPARIAVVDGAATIARDGRLMPAAADAAFVPGDRLRTAAGRVQVIFPDGTTLDVDEQSAVDLQSPTRLRVTAGRVVLTVWGADDPSSAVRYQIDAQDASVWTGAAGEYRVSAIAGEAPVIAVEEQAPVVQVYGGAQMINERCSLVASPSLAALARRQPHRRASTPTFVMTAPVARPRSVPALPVTPPPAPVVVPHSAGVLVAVPRAPAIAQPPQLQPEPVPPPSYVVALPRVKMAPDSAPTHDAPSHVARPTHVAPTHQAPPQAAPSHAGTSQAAGASKMTSSYATRRP